MAFQSLDTFGEEAPAAPEDKGSVGVTDFGKKLGAETLRIGEQAGGLIRGYYEAGKGPTGAKIGKAIESFFGAGAEGLEGSMSPAAREGASAAFTDPKFWEHPFLNGGLKLTGLLPMVAASAIPAGIIADGLWAARGAAAVGGALNAGQVLTEIDKKIDAASDDELQMNSTLYAGLRSVMDEKEARAEFGNTVKGMKPALAGLIGAAAGYIGPAANAIRGIKGEAGVGLAGRGALGGAAVGAAEGGVGGAAQAGSSDALVQGASMEAGLQKDYDLSASLAAAVDGGVLGTVAGGAVGALARGAKPKKLTEKDTDGVQDADQRPQEQGRGVKDAPVEAPAPQPAQEAVVSSGPTPGAKGEAVKALKGKKKPGAAEITVVDAVSPSPEQLIAIADKQQKTLPAPPEVAAASERVAAPAPPEPAPEVAKPAAVPEEVAAASQRVSAPEVTPEVTAPEQPAVSSVPASSDVPAPEPAAPRAPRLLRNLTEPEIAPAKLAPVVEPKLDDQGNKVVPGRNMGPKAREKVAAHRAVSDKIVADHPAGDAEASYFTDKAAQAAVVDRAKAMVAAADAAGHKIPQKISESVNKDQITDHPATHMLVYARDLARAAKSKSTGTKVAEAVQRFKEREGGVKAGRAAEEVSVRKSEGDTAMRRDQGDVGERGATTDTPESILAAKENVEVKSADDLKAEAAATKGDNVVDSKDNTITTGSPVAESRKGTVRGIDDASEKRVIKFKDGSTKEVEGTKGASPVKKIELTDEMKARYLTAKMSRADQRAPRDAKTGEPIKVIKTTTARQALAALDLEHLSGVPRALAEFAKRRLTAMAGDSLVHIVDKAEMARLQGDLAIAMQNDGRGDIGLHRLSLSGEGGFTVVRHDALRTPQETAHVVIHELAHAATMRAIHENPRIHKAIEDVMSEVSEFSNHLPKDIQAKLDYALSNPREFIAEAFSNPDVQEILAHIPVSQKLAVDLNLGTTRRMSVWDAMVSVVRGIIFGGRVPEGHRMVDAVMRLGGKIDLENGRQKAREAEAGGPIPLKLHGLKDKDHLSAALTVKEAGEKAADALTNTGGKLRLIKDKLSSTFMMKERNNDTFGPSRPLNRVFDLRAMQEREKDRILADHGGAEVVKRTAELERTHPEDMSKGAELLFDASLHNVNLGPGAKNDHLGKDATKGWQGKKLLASLQSRFDKLSPEVQKHLQDSVKFFRDIHNEVSMATIRNVLEVANIKEAGLAERIFNDGVNDADRAAHGGEIVKALEKATSLKRLDGWYAPFRRYGDFISTGEHELAVPAGATKVNDNTLQFLDPKGSNIGARRAAKKYIEQGAHTSQGNLLKANEITRVYVDKSDPTKLLEATDPNSVVAYRVRMQTQHTEFHDTLAEAQHSQESLNEAGLQRTTTHKREDAHRSSPGLEGALGTVIRSLENNESFKKLDGTQKAATKQALLDASVRAMSSTNVKTTMAQRRNVAGMSHDLGRVTADYARMTANYLAQLRFRPKIDQVFGEMRDYMKAHKYDSENLRREEVYQEFQSRIYGAADALAARPPSPVIRKLLQVSRLARLAGVSFHVINSQEPWTTSLPMIGGRHGTAQTARTMMEAYNTIGARGGILSGLKDTGRAFTNDSGFTDYVKVFKDNIAKSNTMGGAKSARLMDMLDYMNARNLYGNDAVFEVGKSADPNGNIASRALDRADLMANQVGSAIEAINRSVTGLTAYELEFKKNGGNHEAAMHYAYTIAHETMGDYSSWNAAPMFNTRAGQMALQFKKFGHKTYYMLGKTMQGAIAGDREAAKQFAGLMVTHAMVAGVLGLPTEPFKVALMAANAFGVTGFTPEDYENSVRQLAARLAGAKGGEIISKGLYRGIGVEVSGRMGLDSLFTFGGPKSEKANDIKAFLFDTMAGAPAGYLLDQVVAAQALAKGDVGTAIAKASPIRAVSDVTKAVTGAMGPKLSPAGREQHAALTPYQTGVRALGFTPAATAEDGAMRGAIAHASKKASTERTELVNAWVTAQGGQKVAAQRAVQKFNAGRPKDEQITAKDLASAAKRRESEEENGTVKNGIHITKRTKAVYDRAAATYNP